ncbi:MAG: hypothetical protein MR661_03790 [Prevotella sp.]|nr:hypothetical protein [Prevotella sp.]
MDTDAVVSIVGKSGEIVYRSDLVSRGQLTVGFPHVSYTFVLRFVMLIRSLISTGNSA